MSVPTNLTATAVSSSRVDLSWDDMGASGYDIEVNDVIVVEDHLTTSYTDDGLAPSTERSYRVRSVLP